ncbi:hypothetical protein NE237_030308 [Protea cynaroides]|uniref:Chromo domain-containing protein n=1 Tax=Protea cynaroides TaxID=273540 RepID=A0A9Q0JVN8_9MAGN|nr:hypothetical protein NE237_030308 [Protea cynaroides]
MNCLPNGRSPPSLLTYILSTTKVAVVEQELMGRDAIVKEIREKFRDAQVRTKKIYDSKYTEREFGVGDMVYMKLQPYRQLSVSMKKNLKLSPRYYGPFKIVQRMGIIAFKLELPAGSHIHPVFHVSLFKKKVGDTVNIQSLLPIVNVEADKVFPNPQAVIDHRIRKRKREVLIHWQGASPADATWEDLEFIPNKFLDFFPLRTRA